MKKSNRQKKKRRTKRRKKKKKRIRPPSQTPEAKKKATMRKENTCRRKWTKRISVGHPCNKRINEQIDGHSNTWMNYVQDRCWRGVLTPEIQALAGETAETTLPAATGRGMETTRRSRRKRIHPGEVGTFRRGLEKTKVPPRGPATDRTRKKVSLVICCCGSDSSSEDWSRLIFFL